MDIWGLCPSCDRWFDCHDFHNQSEPMPTCPSCRLAPSKLSYGRRPVAEAYVPPATELWVG